MKRGALLVVMTPNFWKHIWCNALKLITWVTQVFAGCVTPPCSGLPQGFARSCFDCFFHRLVVTVPEVPKAFSSSFREGMRREQRLETENRHLGI